MTTPAPDGAERPTVPPGLLEAMRADPVHAPEILALMAVEKAGPEATAWVRATRAARPGVGPGDLATLVRARFVKLSQYAGAAGGALGLPGSVADTVVTAWTQARMIVHLAAAHGLDPTDRERGAEILYFTGVHKAMSLAERAIDVAAGRRGLSALRGDSSMVRLAMVLSTKFGTRVARRAVTRFVPGVSIPLGWWGNGRATRKLADRAVIYYADQIGVRLHHTVEKLPESRLRRPQLPPGTPPGGAVPGSEVLGADRRRDGV